MPEALVSAPPGHYHVCNSCADESVQADALSWWHQLCNNLGQSIPTSASTMLAGVLLGLSKGESRNESRCQPPNAGCEERGDTDCKGLRCDQIGRDDEPVKSLKVALYEAPIPGSLF